jgi:hypothetical protein
MPFEMMSVVQRHASQQSLLSLPQGFSWVLDWDAEHTGGQMSSDNLGTIISHGIASTVNSTKTLLHFDGPRRPGSASSSISCMVFDEFKEYLTKWNVDVAKFGVGQAKTLEEFFDEVVNLKKSYLVEKGERLQRRLSLVRVKLIATDASGHENSLKMTMDVLRDGRTRKRDVDLAVVIGDGQTWERAVKEYFADKFQISEGLQAQAFQWEANWYKEDCDVNSPSIPGILTTCLT